MVRVEGIGNLPMVVSGIGGSRGDETMRKIRLSDENEMVYEFLKMEICSSRYQAQIETVLDEMNLSRDVIVNGSLLSEQENILRIEMLARFRGYPDKELFENFPKQIKWVWAEFEHGDMSKIRYINYSYWNELSNDTSSPLEAAKTILSGKTIYDVPNDAALKGAQLLKAGHKFPPLIFLTDENQQRYIILEGHGRMTAYGLVPDLFQNVSVLLGICKSEDLDKWNGE